MLGLNKRVKEIASSARPERSALSELFDDVELAWNSAADAKITSSHIPEKDDGLMSFTSSTSITRFTDRDSDELESFRIRLNRLQFDERRQNERPSEDDGNDLESFKARSSELTSDGSVQLEALPENDNELNDSYETGEPLRANSPVQPISYSIDMAASSTHRNSREAPNFNQIWHNLMSQTPCSDIGITERLVLRCDSGLQDNHHSIGTTVSASIESEHQKYSQKPPLDVVENYNKSLQPAEDLASAEEDPVMLKKRIVLESNKFRRAAKQEHADAFKNLEVWLADARQRQDKQAIKEGENLKFLFMQDIWDDFVESYMEHLLRQPAREAQQNRYRDILELYQLLQANQIIARAGSHTITDVVDELNMRQNILAEIATSQLDEVDTFLHGCDTLLEEISTNWNKSVTRMHRLTVVDIREPNLRKEVIAERLKDPRTPVFLMKLIFEVRLSREKLEEFLKWLGQARVEMDEVVGPILDTNVASDMALLGVIQKEEQSERAAEEAAVTAKDAASKAR
ncbi:hypothetical protein EJ08DRAFT_184123 [Tothia fuscella]|uniref:Uncharacterized protein n=1 Tax=Tothia fuscella TaxID=1048955 RepID=A0A9P4TZF5_9PEZI|nr:hypothetical protein EJ08DRAFT_184123 [Tothia fuscella]